MSEKKQIKVKCEPVFPRFYRDETGFGIYDCQLITELDGTIEADRNNQFVIKGIMPKLNLFQPYIIYCVPVMDKQYGLQYNFKSLEIEKPDTTEEQRAYLTTLLTPMQVENIFKVYDKPIDEIMNDTFDVKKVYGFGEKNYPPLRDRIMENFVLYKLLNYLGQYNITYNQIKKIYEKYQSSELALQKIKSNPYILYYDIDGISFTKADKIAQELGIVEKDDERRVRACIRFVLEENQNNDGNTWMKINKLKDRVRELISNYSFDIESIYNNYSEFYVRDNIIALTKTYEVEKDIAYELNRIKNTLNMNVNFDIDKFIEFQEKMQGFKYTEQQRGLFDTILNNGVNVLVGAAGTGKSQELNGLLNMFDEINLDYVLASPSAKAAKVIESYTGRKASTIHRLLQWTPKGFMMNKNNPLMNRIIIVDEISMVDIWLFRSLLRAIQNNSIVLFCGDHYQLEAVSAGNVLFDMMDSKQFNVVKLDKVHRQSLDSGIISIATKTRQGYKFLKNDCKKCITIGNKKDTHIWCADKSKTLNNVIKSYRALLEKFGIDDVAVLTPTKKGEVGTKSLNMRLQQIANPKDSTKNEYKFNEEKNFREGDKVIHSVNNYYTPWYDRNFDLIDKSSASGIFNGEQGIVCKVDNKRVFVDYGKKIILYQDYDFKNLELAYALTIHRYQGSSCDNVILIIDSRHSFPIKRSLIYTGITRAKKRLIICCDPRTINIGIDKNILKNKKTFLKELLLN